MNRIDYELGLIGSSNDDFQNADGKGVAKASWLACEGACTGRHPFSSSKRNDCKKKCKAAYYAKLKFIDSQVATATSDDVTEAARRAAEEAEKEANRIAAEKLAAEKAAAEKAQKALESELDAEKNKGLSMGAKIGIGVGVAALILVSAVAFKKRK